ncbi:glycosyltransferase [Dyadobacter jiangsuensis]|uniref:GT2 family glycosyltransferase n=1 Tax=Dyadobacter jiangsuensis TaxID=1591085 RepID=A0A2P8G8M3_9BACT|nr:glycosyltransferase [Dyadobacter jiangsuensis]PSL30326.1 GT2 family glycosyltransferase [Dyadobacter jiangsuensis]
MISIIICSANDVELAHVSENIRKTVGVAYEIIAIDNRREPRGICAVYNEGAKRARFDLLCFMHEDIEMMTADWGARVLDIFDQNPQLGLLGIAGGGYKSLAPSSWYNYHLQENGGFYCNLVQGYRHTGREDTVEYRNPRNQPLSRVACIDGCWMCTRKEVVRRFPFDEKLLTGFHGYDLDFSIAVNQEYQVAVTFEVLLKHFSEGNFNQTWRTQMLKVHQKWPHLLPLNIDGVPDSSLKRIERDAYEVFLQKAVEEKWFSKWELARLIWTSRHSRVATLSFPYKLMLRLRKMKPD